MFMSLSSYMPDICEIECWSRVVLEATGAEAKRKPLQMKNIVTCLSGNSLI